MWFCSVVCVGTLQRQLSQLQLQRKCPHLFDKADFIVKDMMIFKRPGVDNFIAWALDVFDVSYTATVSIYVTCLVDAFAALHNRWPSVRMQD